VTASIQNQPSRIPAHRLLQLLGGDTPEEWNAGLIPLLHSKYPRDLRNDKEGKEGPDREEACTGHPRVLEHLFVDGSR
jgi:hypothetical protein